MFVFALMCLLGSGCALTVPRAKVETENDASVPIAAEATLSTFPPDAAPAKMPSAVLRVTSRATPRPWLPTGGQHLQVIAWSFTAEGADIRIPPILGELNTATGRVADARGVPYVRNFTLRELDTRRVLADPVDPSPASDRRSTGLMSFAAPTIIHAQETVVFVMTIDTSESEAVEYASAEHLYRFTLGDGSNLLDPTSVHTVDGREVRIVGNSPITRDLHILPVGHPVVQPLDADQYLLAGERIFLHWRLRSSGASITLKRFVTSYTFEDGRETHVPLALTFQHERDGEPLLNTEASFEASSPSGSLEQATSVRFMPEMWVGGDWIDFVVRGQVTSPVFSGARLTFSMSLAPFTETAGSLTPFEQVFSSGLLGPHIWTSRDETCRLLDPTSLATLLQPGIFVWSPLTDGFHDDIPCGSPDWYGALYRDAERVRITNPLIAP